MSVSMCAFFRTQHNLLHYFGAINIFHDNAYALRSSCIGHDPVQQCALATSLNSVHIRKYINGSAYHRLSSLQCWYSHYYSILCMLDKFIYLPFGVSLQFDSNLSEFTIWEFTHIYQYIIIIHMNEHLETDNNNDNSNMPIEECREQCSVHGECVYLASSPSWHSHLWTLYVPRYSRYTRYLAYDIREMWNSCVECLWIELSIIFIIHALTYPLAPDNT